MELYHNWGFRDNPFKPTPLEFNEYTEQLLVGRASEVDAFCTRFFNDSSIVTVGGLTGIGKTSLINVALFKCYESYFSKGAKCLFIPCHKNFQILPDKHPEDFVDDVFFEIATTLLTRIDELTNLGFEIPDNSVSIDKWLNSPILSDFQITLGPFGLGAGESINSSKGFERTGFRHIVKKWLKTIFPEKIGGGVVCTIDNFDKGGAEFARKYIEQLRDSLFSLAGVRWIFCGEFNTLNSLASSPRLRGLLHDPIEILPIHKDRAKDIYSTRIKYCVYPDYTYCMPITDSCFELLFKAFSQNIRNTLKYANEFCMYVYDQKIAPKNRTEKETLFWSWVNMIVIRHYCNANVITIKHKFKRTDLILLLYLKENQNISNIQFQKIVELSKPLTELHFRHLIKSGFIRISRITGQETIYTSFDK